MRELAIRETCMSECAGLFGYPVHVLPNPPHAKQPYRAHYARARNSRALHGGKRWPIWVYYAGTPLSVTCRKTLTSALCSSSQFARTAYAESSCRFGYPVQVIFYLPPAKQPYRARYARARKSRALHSGKRWPILVSFAGTPVSVTRRAILPSALCASLQFARPAWRKELDDLNIQCRYSPISHTQRNPTESLMCELASREPFMAESAARFGFQCR
jgi:hypothetical protein